MKPSTEPRQDQRVVCRLFRRTLRTTASGQSARRLAIIDNRARVHAGAKFRVPISIDLERQVAQEILGWTACRVRAGPLFGYPPDSTGEGHELEKVPAYAEDLLDA